jgi:hypothetical protein
MMFFNYVFYEMIQVKFKNRLRIHVDLVVMMFTHNHYSIDIFPFADVIKN